jgi:hypothetical protein
MSRLSLRKDCGAINRRKPLNQDQEILKLILLLILLVRRVEHATLMIRSHLTGMLEMFKNSVKYSIFLFC